MPVNNVSPPLGGVSNAVNTSICIPPAPVTLSMLTVESIVILALAVPGFVTLTDVGTATPPTGATGKYIYLLIPTDLRYCVVPSNIPHHTTGTCAYSHSKSAGGCGPVEALFVTLIVTVLLVTEHKLSTCGVNVTVRLTAGPNVLSSVVLIVKLAAFELTVTVPVSAVDTLLTPVPVIA